VVLAIAGYFVILSGKVFKVGDRFAMGGVCRDVDRTGVHPHGHRGDGPVAGRPLRMIPRCGSAPGTRAGSSPSLTTRPSTSPSTTSRAILPTYGEDIRLPVRYGDDWARAEQILLEAARRHTTSVSE
jgi:hypothetical protein